MNNKNIIVVLFLMFITVSGFANEELNLMPYFGLSRTSNQVEILGEEETVTGYEIGGEYQFYEDDALKIGGRVGLRNINADSTNLFASYEVQLNILTVGASVAYDMDVAGNVLSPFATVDVGMGLAKANGSFLGEDFESDSKSHPYASVAMGARYKVGKYVPFVQGGYQMAKVDDLGFAAFDNTDVTEVDYSGAYVTVGLGVLF